MKVLRALLLLSLLPVFSPAQEESAGQSAEKPPERPEIDISLHALIHASRGGHRFWRPDWPLSFPPDMFLYDGPQPSGPVSSMTITVTLEEPGAEGVSLTLSFKDGVFGDFPVFLEKILPGPSEGRHEGRALQGRAQWGPAGALKLLSCIPSGQGEVSAALEAETLSFDEESRPVLLRVKTGETYAFAVLDYAVRRITETWFDEEGNPLLALVPEERGNGRGSYLYNSQGLISELLTPAGTWSALYTSRGLPRYMERRPAAEGPSAAEEGAGQGGADAGQVNAGRTDADPQSPAPPVERYTFQWDEAGRLVRLSGGPGGTPSSDYRYTYVLDDRGNWIERREIRMISREGGLFPAPGLRVRRSFSYGE